jgi:hypothetical protein
MWLGRSERGENSVVMTEGYQYKVITTPAVSWALNQYAVVSDAIGYTYTEEGHEFYVLILPTADVTWVYDLTTGNWHQRLSFDPATGQFHRQRVNCVGQLRRNLRGRGLCERPDLRPVAQLLRGRPVPAGCRAPCSACVGQGRPQSRRQLAPADRVLSPAQDWRRGRAATRKPCSGGPTTAG